MQLMPKRQLIYNTIKVLTISLNFNSLNCREWGLLRNLPKLTVIDGSPLNRADLRAVKVNLCRSCIILSARAPDRLEPVLADKEIIMAALNIKSMTFKEDSEKLKVSC